MYQEDMVNEGDGCGGMPIHPKVSIQSSASAQSFTVVGRGSLEDVPPDEVDDPEPLPYNGSELSGDKVQGQYHEYPGQQHLPLPPKACYSAEHIERLSRSRSQSISPQRFRASVEKTDSRDKRSMAPTRQSSQDNYVLMPTTNNMEIEQPKHDKKRSRRRKAEASNDVDDLYEANVALSIQFAMVFFCFLILVAIFMTIFSIQGYVVIVVVCLVILISLLIGLCTFVYQVVNEEDSPRMNGKHMPRWYKTLTKIIKDEIADFREDWKNMYNGMYLLEGGDAGNNTNDNSNEGSGNNKDKSKKKRKGKSAVFKMIAKPAAVFANFRRKRKEKKKQKKAEKAAAESYFPPIV